jgi:hypothetical protein
LALAPNQENLESTWRSFIEGDDESLQILRRIIRDSWQRCRKSGVDPNLRSVRFIEDVLHQTVTPFLPILKGEQQVTDQEFDVATPLRRIKVTVTSRRISGKGGEAQGVVLIFNEIARARKISRYGLRAGRNYGDSPRK